MHSKGNANAANQYRLLGNYPPIPPLTQHFALSEQKVIMLA